MTKNQTKRFLWAVPMLLGLWASPALAQKCDTVGEEIVRLKPPAFQNYTAWDEVLGGEGMEQFSDLLPLPGGSVVAAGSYTKDDKDAIYKPFLVHMTPKGEVLWETREDEKSFKTINRITAFGKGYAVLGEVNEPARGDGIYIAFYDENGKRLRQYPVFEKDHNIDGKAIVATPDGKAVIVAAQVNPGGGTGGQYGVLYKFSADGKRLWRHGYTPGTRSVFHHLAPSPLGGYIVSGEVELPDARMGGWLIRVDDNGAVMWQRSYARGSHGAFLTGVPLGRDAILLAGQVKPSGGGRTSGWVMKVKAGNGDIEWQRYYHGNGYDYMARDVLPYDDGRSVVLLAGMPKSLADRTHMRLMTFSPRGYLMNVEEFSEAQGAQGFTLNEGFQGERIIAGYTQMKYAETEAVSGIPINTFDGWIAAAPPMDPYEDPCLPQSYLP